MLLYFYRNSCNNKTRKPPSCGRRVSKEYSNCDSKDDLEPPCPSIALASRMEEEEEEEEEWASNELESAASPQWGATGGLKRGLVSRKLCTVQSF